MDEKKTRRGSEEPFNSKDAYNLEAQLEPLSTMSTAPVARPVNDPAEYSVPMRKKFLFLGLYFFLNLTLTLSNKAVMQTARFPWLLTVMHSSSTAFACFCMVATGHIKLSKLSSRDHLVLVAFSLLFTVNIAVSNVSLALVSVPFHQVLRSTVPVATVSIYKVVYGRSYSRETYMSMIPLVLGVALATFGDYYFTMIGFILTLLGVFLAALKSVATNRLLTGSLSLGTMEVLLRMSPLAAVQCLLYAAANGELSEFREAVGAGIMTRGFCFALLGNAITALLLNMVSFQTNKVAGALTVSVCGNVKSSLTIILGVILFHVKVSPLNGLGTMVTVAAAAYYSSVELANKKKTIPALKVSAPSLTEHEKAQAAPLLR